MYRKNEGERWISAVQGKAQDEHRKKGSVDALTLLELVQKKSGEEEEVKALKKYQPIFSVVVVAVSLMFENISSFVKAI